MQPDNILLSSGTPCHIRLADFGQTMTREQNSVQQSTLVETNNTHGTPIYSAPELLHNPYRDLDGVDSLQDDQVYQPSRKTDVYAFAILAWEVLTEQKPFSNIYKESLLGAKIHQGYRPSLADLPADTPKRLTRLIEKCWDGNRSKRYTAVECYSVLQYLYNTLTKARYDVYLSHDETYHLGLSKFIFHRLSQHGYSIYFNQGHGTDHIRSMNETDTAPKFDPRRVPKVVDKEETMRLEAAKAMQGNSAHKSHPDTSETGAVDTPNPMHEPTAQYVSRSKLMVVLASASYQKKPACMEHVITAKRTKPESIPILPVFLGRFVSLCYCINSFIASVIWVSRIHALCLTAFEFICMCTTAYTPYIHIEPDYLEWCNQEFVYCCQLRSASVMSVDISDIVDQVRMCVCVYVYSMCV